MSAKEWAAVVAVIGVGVLLPIVGHDDAAMSMEVPESSGPMKTVALDVTGMT